MQQSLSGEVRMRCPRGGKRERIHRRIKRNLQKVPGTETVEYVESRTGVEMQVRATVDTDIYADGVVDAETAHIYADWWPQPAGEPDRFKVHYTDSTGADCGFHRQENDHVEGLDHYQMRSSPSDPYHYESIGFDYDNPAGIIWEVVHERLPERLKEQYE